MKITLESSQQEASLVIAGKLEQYSLTQNFWLMPEAKDLAQISKLKVDLSQIERADTAGLAWLINLKRDATLNNIQCVLKDVPSKLLDLAELSGARTILLEEESNDK